MKFLKVIIRFSNGTYDVNSFKKVILIFIGTSRSTTFIFLRLCRSSLFLSFYCQFGSSSLWHFLWTFALSWIYSFCHIFKKVVYLQTVLCWYSKVICLAAFSILFSLLFWYFSGVLKISFVASKSEDNSFGSVLLKFHDPLFCFVKTLNGSDIIADDGSSSFSIVNGCNWIVLFLTRSILVVKISTQIVSFTDWSLSSLTFF